MIIAVVGWLQGGDEGAGLVVLALMGDVVGGLVQVARADGEGGVSTLPLEERSVGRLVGDEVGGGAFEVLDQIGDADGGGQTDEEMDVILDAAKGDDLGAKRHALVTDGAVDAPLHIPSKEGQAIPGGPHKMDEHGNTRMTHLSIPSGCFTLSATN